MLEILANWFKVKFKIHEQNNPPTFKEKDVWWCNLGQNIGCEENGKNQFFTRPVLIIRKFNKNMCLVVPLTTQIKENSYYFKVNFAAKIQCVMISQIRTIDSKRLWKKMGNLNDLDFQNVRVAIKNLI